MTAWLFKFDSGEAFAFSTDGRNWFTAQGQAWAWRQNDWLWSFQGGKAVGWFQGDNVFSPEGVALYFRRPQG